MLWKVKDNGVQSGSEPVGSTRALSRSVHSSVLQLFLSRHLCLSVTHAHIHRSFSLTHLNAVSLFLSPSVGGMRCAALQCRGLSPPQVRQAPLLWWIYHFSPALSDSRSPGLHPLPLSPPAHLLIWERKYISYISQIHPPEPAGTALIWNTDQHAIIYLMHWQREGGRNKWQNADVRCSQWAKHVRVWANYSEQSRTCGRLTWNGYKHGYKHCKH